MPRPKVHPANRLRAYEACNACRSTKKRCSGTFPCSKCIRLGRADTCVPSPRSAAQRPTANTRISGNSNASYDSGRRPTTTLSAGSLAGRADSASIEASEPSRSTVDTQPMSPETLHRTHPRMLRNLRGERGNIALTGYIKCCS